MCDIYSFLTAMKLSWIRRLSNNSLLQNFTSDIYPSLMKLKSFGSNYAQTISQSIDNQFWKDVLKHYIKTYLRCEISNGEDFLSECLHHNPNIMRGKKVIYIKEWINEGIIQIAHMTNDLGFFMSYREFQNKYPNIQNTNFLIFEGVLKAVKQYKKKCNVELIQNYSEGDPKFWVCLFKGNKFITSIFTKSEIIPTAVLRWNEFYEDLDWNTIFRKCFKTTLDSRLIWFQYRLIHRLLPTEKFLHIRQLVDSSLCLFCKQETETIQHLFWDCTIISQFWSKLLNLLQNKCSDCKNLQFFEKFILFGLSNDNSSDSVLDLIILHAKFFIYKCKLQKIIPNVDIFIKILQSVYYDMKYLSKICDNSLLFDLKWNSYVSLF